MKRLSKSRFMSGLQCPLRLWNDAFRRELASPPDDTLQAIFNRGTAIGELAQQRWPGGTLVGFKPWEREPAVAKTQKLMTNPNVPAIYEAAIEHGGVYIRVDILARNGHGWDLIEVKGSSSPEKEVFQQDVAVQHWVAKGAGLTIQRAGILVLNWGYIYPGGDYDLDELFTFFDSTEDCLAAAEWVEENVGRFHHILNEENPPDIPIGDHCFTPYDCPYYAHCSEGVEFPAQPVDNLYRLHPNRRAELQARGIEAIPDIPEEFPLTEVQQRIRQAVLNQTPWQSARLQRELENVTWPLYYLDFESFAPALPLYPGTRPFQAIPFQYSLHIESAGGEVTHQEYLHTESTDPRPALAQSLLDTIGSVGSILVYSGYERRMINEMAVAAPGFAPQLKAVTERLWDLLPIVRNHYYHPDFNGSFSIKAVLPALVPGADWSDLSIADGMAAATNYEQALQGEDPKQRQRIFSALREYCKQDTLAMVKLRGALIEKSKRI